MALTAAHPGVVRWRKMLWVTDPDVKDATRAPKGPPLRGGSPWAYLIVAVVFAPVILLPIYVPWKVQQLLGGWVPGADSETGFQGILGVSALIVLVMIAWLVYWRPEAAIPGASVRTRAAVDVFAQVGVDVNDEMAWKDLWDLADAVETLNDKSTEEFVANEAGDRAEASRIRSIIETQMVRARRAAKELRVEPNLSFFEEAPTT